MPEIMLGRMLEQVPGPCLRPMLGQTPEQGRGGAL
jgi:hypothetical protein